MFGQINSQIQRKIKNYLKNPCFETWDNIHCIVINSKDMKTIWNAVIDIDPCFPRKGRKKDEEGNTITEWERIPEPFILLQAIRKATQY